MGERPTGITILAVLQTLAGLIYLIAGSGVVLVGGVLGGVFGAIGSAIGIVFVVLGLVEFVVAWGYLTRKGWARWAGLILAAIGVLEGLTSLPNGILSIAIDGVVLYYLTRPYIIDWFAGRTPEPAAPVPPPPTI
jgi:hypothetical protein